VHALAPLAVLGHERRFGDVVEAAKEALRQRREQQRPGIRDADIDQEDQGAAAVADHEARLAPDAIGDQPGRNGADPGGDGLHRQAQGDELDGVQLAAQQHYRLAGKQGQQIKIEQHVPGAVHQVHAGDVQEVEAGVAAEQPHVLDVAAQPPRLRQRRGPPHGLPFPDQAVRSPIGSLGTVPARKPAVNP
jgi:hypothetical protein